MSLRIKDNFGQAAFKVGSDSAFLNEVSNPFHISALKFTDDQ